MILETAKMAVKLPDKTYAGFILRGVNQFYRKHTSRNWIAPVSKARRTEYVLLLISLPAILQIAVRNQAHRADFVVGKIYAQYNTIDSNSERSHSKFTIRKFWKFENLKIRKNSMHFSLRGLSKKCLFNVVARRLPNYPRAVYTQPQAKRNSSITIRNNVQINRREHPQRASADARR